MDVRLPALAAPMRVASVRRVNAKKPDWVAASGADADHLLRGDRVMQSPEHRSGD